MKPIWSILLTLAAHSALAAQSLEIDFASGKLADYVFDEKSGRVQIAAADGGKALVIADTIARFRDAAVKPTTRYTLTLDAAFEGPVESIEENPRFEIFTRLGRTSPRLPTREIRFYDAGGKPAGQPLKYAMPFKSRRSYKDAFYTPPGAVSARIGLASGKDIRLTIAKLKLEPTADEGALNINPAFQLGAFNYSGWENISAGGQLIERDDKTILDTKYGSTGQKFPLAGAGTYALSAKATGNGFNSVVKVRVYDLQGQLLMEKSTRKYGPRIYFVPPKGAAFASFLVYSCLLEEVRLVRVGDEKAIETLQ